MGAALPSDIDPASARREENRFEEAIGTAVQDGDRAVILDFEKLVYIGSAGLRAVLMIAKNLWKREATFALCSLPDMVRGVFEVSGFDKIVTIHPSKADALAAVSA